MSKKLTRPGPKGIAPDEIVRAGIALMEEEGAEGFSVRKLGNTFGCDPMAVLYHFRSKLGLERAMADALNAEVKPVNPNAPWRERLADLAHQYRALALRYPQTFPLLTRFWMTGPSDYRHAEMVYQALDDAGLDDEQISTICCGWYASVLGLATAEVGGMLQAATQQDLAEVEALPADRFPVVKRLVPVFKAQKPGQVHAVMVEMLLDAIEQKLTAS